MMVGTLVVYFAVTGKDTLVSDDYYKEGKGINLDISKVKKAEQLGLIALMKVTDSSINLTFESQLPPDNAAIQANFFHTTLSEHDVALLLTKNAQGEYTTTLETPLTGKWRVTLSAFDESWKIQRRVALPSSSVIRFEP